MTVAVLLVLVVVELAILGLDGVGREYDAGDRSGFD
jgi:hypothetical protein